MIAGSSDPAMILDQIIAYKKEFVAQAKRRIAPAEMQRRAEEAPLPPRDFRAALRRPGQIAVIAEVKKASPSKGVIRAAFDPVSIARSYARHRAAAISCLTDEKFFQGSLEVFRAVRAAVGLPLLRKEFIIDEYQIDEARAHGADAVLLIASILDDAALKLFRERAERYGMAALVEAHSSLDARRAVDSGATVIGVNNRDLASPDFHTDVRHAERILPLLPEGVVRVSESGIHSAADVAYLRGLGVDAILVGEQLMRQSDPGQAIDALLGRV
ncbi:MAG: indole-3-glycerol phosphate synthase TrpC [Candidatus Sumerlaeota bacterium]|nr:indole-3-glycerol phosphate synthase TrpC [Candidatus Sumerlaeota bacterium]